MLYSKLIDGMPIKTVGIWKDESWGSHNLIPALEGIGKLHYLPVPVNHNNDVSDRVAFSNKIFETVKKIEPDLVYCYIRSRWVNAEPFMKMQRTKIVTINLSLDDTHKFNQISDIAPAFTLNQTSTKSALIQYANCGANAIYLPSGASSKYMILENTPKDIDVCFIGRRYGNRAKAINMLRQAGINVVVRGKRWKDGPVSFDKMLNLYSRSKIVLGFSHTSSKTNTCSIKGRDFEVPMCGAFYLCEKNPELRDWFRPNDIVFWDNFKDLLAKTKYYLQHKKRRQTIACMGHYRAATKHTWDDRFAVLFRYLEKRLI